MDYEKKDGEERWKKDCYDECVFDMMKMLVGGGSLEGGKWKKGDRVKLGMCDGGGGSGGEVKYGGKVRVKGDKGMK